MKRLLPAFILLAFGVGAWRTSMHHIGYGFAPPAAAVDGKGEAFFRSSFASSKLHTQTHAASLVELKNGRIRAFWFSGSREGARDVEIHSAVFDPAKETWGVEQIVATRAGTMQGLQRYVSKLGNPVAARAADGTLWLYYVTVSAGGWAGSSITAMSSADEGQTWSRAQRLVTSPFLNISTLVKGTPFLYADGSMGLPVYHEFISKFGEILHFDKDGGVIDKQRLTAGGDGALQPVVLAKNADEALVLMRYSGMDTPHRVVSVATADGGRNWSAPEKSALANPDAAVTALALPDGRMLAVLNNQEGGRDALSLMLSGDGGASWKELYRLEDERKQPLDEEHYLKTVEGLVGQGVGGKVGDYVASVRETVCREHACRYEFSYPYLIRAHNGDFHLAYTWNRTFIRHVTFNQAWLEQQEASHE